MDFVIEHEGAVLPIKIKSGKDYKYHNALNNVLENKEYAIKEALVFTNGNIKTKGRITYLPIYMLMHLKPSELQQQVFRFQPI